MGIRINRNNILEETQSIRGSIEETKHQVSLIFESINKFNDTKDVLTGKAWDACREYSDSVLLPVLRMYIECLDLEYDANTKYSESAERLPGYEKLDEDIIIAAKEKFERRLDREYNREFPRNSIINFYEKKIARCEKLLDIICEFCDETSGIFDEVKSRQDYLSRLHYYLKMINMDKTTGEMLLPPGSVNIPYAKDEIDRYYRGIKSKELIERKKELEEIYKSKGAKAVIQNILTKPVEGCLNTDIESEEYTMIAKLMVESRDDEYVELINTAVYYCYEYEKTMSNHQGYFNTVNDIYKKNDKVDKILGGLIEHGKNISAMAKVAKTADYKLAEDRKRFMQLFEVFNTLLSYKGSIVSSKLFARQGDNGVTKERGEYKIKASRNEENDIVINFVEYGANVDSGAFVPFEAHKDISITIKLPQQGAGAADELRKTAQRYIYESLNCDVPMGTQAVVNFADYVVTMLLSNFAPRVGDAVTTVKFVVGEIKVLKDSDNKVFAKAEEISGVGPTMDYFNLFYVQAKTDKVSENIDKSYIIFPAYIGDTFTGYTTQELIDEFNSKFSKGGMYEDYAEKIGYNDEKPLTEEDLIENFDKVSIMIGRWEKAAIKNGKNPRSAVERIR